MKSVAKEVTRYQCLCPYLYLYRYQYQNSISKPVWDEIYNMAVKAVFPFDIEQEIANEISIPSVV